ncbi:MAG: 6-carboxytetrahydropterin synthase QueD, partial [Nitrospirae bacterium]
IKKKIEDIEDVQMAGVTVWESDTASATYYE